jgi:alpha-galactosidase/6-phospho-beta-glucosidase family protein
MVGAGSAVFARQIITDILAVDGLDRGVFALADIDPVRLDLARRIAERLVEVTDKAWTVEASTERLDVLKGTDYVAVHELVVEALLERDRQKAMYALMIDPLTAAVCSPAEIEKMFDEMWAAERESLSAFE